MFVKSCNSRSFYYQIISWRIIATEMKYMRRTAGYTWTDYKTNAQIAKELKMTPILDKLLEYKRSWIQYVNRVPRNRLPRVMKHYSPTGRRNHGRPLKRLLDTWDRNGSTSGPTPWKICDDDDYDDYITMQVLWMSNKALLCFEGTVCIVAIDWTQRVGDHWIYSMT